MNTDNNIATLNQIYAAFGRGDAPAILEPLHPDLELEFGSLHGDALPWHIAGRGREHFAGFLGRVAAHLEFRHFEVLAVMAQGPWVVALIKLEALVKKTGRILREECEAHIWRFDEHGRVVAMRHAADTLHHAQAYGLV
jgi:ketosteroid isomerase-like protein